MKIKIRSIEDEEDGLEDKKIKKSNSRDNEEEEERIEDIKDSLSEIYRDSKGNKIDVDHLKIKQRQGFVFWFFNFLVFGLITIVAALGFYYYLIHGKGTDSSSLSLEIQAPESVIVGEEFYYTVKYSNSEYVALKNAILKMKYPDKFIYLDSSVNPSSSNDTWIIGRIEARSEGELKIKGRILDQEKSSSVAISQMTYIPENFSSEFKKETSRGIFVSGLGFDVDFDYSNSALVGEDSSVKIKINPKDVEYLSDFVLRIEKKENIDIKDVSSDSENDIKIEKIKNTEQDTWLVSEINKGGNINIDYRIKEKISGDQDFKIFFEENIGGQNYVFLEKDITLEVINSDLNLTLIMNGSQSNNSVNFGDELNYSLSYLNKGETPMKDVALSIVLDSDFLDWTKLKDENNGRERGNVITWTKEELPALEEIFVNKGGTIDFSIEVLPFSEGDMGKDFKISAYGEYYLNFNDNNATTTNRTDNKSNTIESSINSDLGFRVEARYFDENNLPVGNGPLPPKVGEKTSLKMYLTVTNNLHDLSNVKVETVLPEGVFWDDHNRTSVGSIDYDNSSRKVVWQIGRLPITVFRSDAEFNIMLTPKEEDRNKIMIVLSNAMVTARDSVTGADIEKTSIPKTTKLDDDEIANMSSDGVVR